MATNYFSKWVGAAAYKKIREKEVIDFIWNHVICRVKISKEITCDNGPQFIGAKVTSFLEELSIKSITSSPYHPSGYNHAESTNKTVILNLKKKLEDAKGAWPSKLPEVLWAYRTTMKSSIDETPFFLVYGAKALIPMEVEAPNSWYDWAQRQANSEAMSIQLALLEEHRDLAYVRIMAQKQQME
ncbi:uncharacterized protein LOC132057685 [Lycium ferocissimum]|uniref:uncharacterized protein LOC132057685 n=1 Tax=Lycium ferocissimum TaxID=112874 RepID=UPI002814CC92|nr:uncharacterized protein LOC132057685 [Lycium ferocissimum]